MVESIATTGLKPSIRTQVVPGTTYGNPALQEATLAAAKDAFTWGDGLPVCLKPEIQVSDTWPLGEPSLSEFNQAFIHWRELWTFEACGGSVDAEVNYMLHQTTGVIDVKISPQDNGWSLELG